MHPPAATGKGTPALMYASESPGEHRQKHGVLAVAAVHRCPWAVSRGWLTLSSSTVRQQVVSVPHLALSSGG
jgi:hypothetical protein